MNTFQTSSQQVEDRSISELPLHIVADILSRLPLKTILYCRFVCKEWLNLLKDPLFIKNHLARSNMLLLNGCIGDLRLIDPESSSLKFSAEIDNQALPQASSYMYVNSCNGLVCFYSCLSWDPFCICNPITGEYLSFPQVERESCKISGFGFGFCSKINKYKVLRILDPQPSAISTINGVETKKYQVEVMTLGTGSWRSVEDPPCYFSACFCTLLNEALHWTSYDEATSICILAFNLEIEQFLPIPSPPCFTPDHQTSPDMCFEVRSLGGCLCFFESDEWNYDIWVMKEYGVKESWTKQFTIAATHSLYSPIMYLSNGNILFLHIVHFISSTSLFYNPAEDWFSPVKLDCYPNSLNRRGISALVPSFMPVRDALMGKF